MTIAQHCNANGNVRLIIGIVPLYVCSIMLLGYLTVFVAWTLVWARSHGVRPRLDVLLAVCVVHADHIVLLASTTAAVHAMLAVCKDCRVHCWVLCSGSVWCIQVIKLSADSARIVMIWNRVFVNNSGNPKPIRAKFHAVTDAQMGRSLETLGAFGQGQPKWPRKTEHFVKETRSRNATSGRIAWDLEKICKWKRITIFRIRVTYPKTDLWSVFQLLLVLVIIERRNSHDSFNALSLKSMVVWQRLSNDDLILDTNHVNLMM